MSYTVGVTEARANFSRILDRVQMTGEPVTILKNNKPLAVIGPPEDVPNEETLAAFEEVERLKKDPGHKHFANVKDLMDAMREEAKELETGV